MNRHVTVHDRYHARNCTRAYHTMRRALDDGRNVDALVHAVEALTLADVGYGDELPPGALAELRETMNTLSSGDGVEVGR